MTNIQIIDSAHSPKARPAPRADRPAACHANSRWRGMGNLARAVLLAAVALGLIAPAASADSPDRSLSGLLGALWTKALETPTPQNAFAGGDPCIKLGGHIVAPFAGGDEFSCTVSPRTQLLAIAWTTEASTFEDNGTTEAELRESARSQDAGISVHTVRLDGTPVLVTEVESKSLSVKLPGNNIFGLQGSARKGLSVAHGWVALLDPLSPGTHVIEIDVQGTYHDEPLDVHNRTTILVQ